MDDYENHCYQSIPLTYFDPLSSNKCIHKQLVAVDTEKQSNDIVFLIKQEIDESKQEIIHTLKDTEGMLRLILHLIAI